MTDIPKMLRDEALNADEDWTGIYVITPSLAFAAADRIEKLEAALREIDAWGEEHCMVGLRNLVRTALEGKDE